MLAPSPPSFAAFTSGIRRGISCLERFSFDGEIVLQKRFALTLPKITDMLSRKDILDKLEELKPFLKEEYGVREIGLFGSFSQNEASEQSDIDLLVDYDRYLGWKTIQLGIYLEEIFGRKVDLVSKNALKTRIKDSILNQIIYIN